MDTLGKRVLTVGLLSVLACYLLSVILASLDRIKSVDPAAPKTVVGGQTRPSNEPVTSDGDVLVKPPHRGPSVASDHKTLAPSNKSDPPAAAIQISPPRAFVISAFPGGPGPLGLSASQPGGPQPAFSGATLSKFDLRFNGVVILCVAFIAVLAAIFFQMDHSQLVLLALGVLSVLIIGSAIQWIRTAAAIERLLWRYCFDHYRPELHYMRGPGPRCRQKHGRIDGPALTNRSVVSVHRRVGEDEACPKAELGKGIIGPNEDDAPSRLSGSS